jgi:hypothetical protein
VRCHVVGCAWLACHPRPRQHEEAAGHVAGLGALVGERTDTIRGVPKASDGGEEAAAVARADVITTGMGWPTCRDC